MIGVFIGRMQGGLHNGHIANIERMTSENDRSVIIFGSANIHRSQKNPFTVNERRSIVQAYLENRGYTFVEENQYLFAQNTTNGKAICLFGVEDTNTDESWKQLIFSHLQEIKAIDNSFDYSDGNLYGYDKDASTYYLRIFNEFTFRPVNSGWDIDATTIRNFYFSEGKVILREFLPEETIKFLETWELYSDVKEEIDFLNQCKEQNNAFRYPPTYMTGDAAVFHRNKLLTIRRKNVPGKNMQALPGGYMDAYRDDNRYAASKREATEECGVQLCDSWFIGGKPFEDINRSQRGRICTECNVFVIPDYIDINPNAGDDAKEIVFIEVGDIPNLNKLDFFEDHYDMIQWAFALYSSTHYLY